MTAVHGLEAKQGDTAFAFLVLRLIAPVGRAALVQLVRRLAPVVADADGFLDGLPEEMDEPMKLVGLPWAPPEAGHAVDVQRRLIEETGSLGVEAAWFFQTGTSLPAPDDDDDDGDDDEDDDDDVPATSSVAALPTMTIPIPIRRATTTDETWGEPDDEATSVTRELELMTTADTPVLDDELNTSVHTPRLEPAPLHGAIVSGTIGERPRAVTSEPVDELDEGALELEDDPETRPSLDSMERADAAGMTDVDEGDGDDGDDDEDEDARWSHGPPPTIGEVPFPVDGYPAIIDELDWEDFGIAVKLRGTFQPGENTALLGFHALWLSPYGGRYRNAAVTIDRRHHAAHLWVDRFAVSTSNAEQVHHLLWVLSKLHEVVPIAYARFEGATMAQKYAGLMGDTSEPFVLGGNPLIGKYKEGGDAAVDAMIADPQEWSKDELAAMLRELAVGIVTDSLSDDDGGGGDDDDDAGEGGDEVDAIFDAGDGGKAQEPAVAGDEDDDGGSDGSDDDEDDDDDDDSDDDDDDDEDDDEDEPDDEDPGQERTSNSRMIAVYAAEILAARAAMGKTDRRLGDRLVTVVADTATRAPAVGGRGASGGPAVRGAAAQLASGSGTWKGATLPGEEADQTSSYDGAIGNSASSGTPASADHAPIDITSAAGRQRAAIDILTALRHRGATTALVATLGAATNRLAASANPEDVELVGRAASAIGAIADVAAIPALSRLAAERRAPAPARIAAAAALARCLATKPEPRDIAPGVVDGLLAAIGDGSDGDAIAGHLAFAKLASLSARRTELRAALADTTRDVPLLVRRVALLAGEPPAPDVGAQLRAELHEALDRHAEPGDDGHHVRLALAVAELVPDLVDTADVAPLTRSLDAGIRARAHALLEQLGHPMPPARLIDARTASALDDAELVQLLTEPHVIGRDIAVAIARERGLLGDDERDDDHEAPVAAAGGVPDVESEEDSALARLFGDDDDDDDGELDVTEDDSGDDDDDDDDEETN